VREGSHILVFGGIANRGINAFDEKLKRCFGAGTHLVANSGEKGNETKY
jgi:hypothetical protein